MLRPVQGVKEEVQLLFYDFERIFLLVDGVRCLDHALETPRDDGGDRRFHVCRTLDELLQPSRSLLVELLQSVEHLEEYEVEDIFSDFKV